jgi:poly(3-hydroxybutyrate) depolymerase
MFNYFDNSYLYTLVEMQRAAVSPMNMMARVTKGMNQSPLNPVSYTGLGKSTAAFYELLERVTRHYQKPAWGITSTAIGKTKKHVDIYEVIVDHKPFCDLLHFKKDPEPKKALPKLLVVAPVSGHYATLLRGTIKELLPYFDVYVTEWINARDVPMPLGNFAFDDYVQYLIDFMHVIDEPVHVMGVCQPSVPVMAATSLMATNKDKLAPKSITLIGGPIDTRINPTKVNALAEERSIEWFEKNVITRVPVNYPGFMRRVYPGFLQLSGFMTMNLDRHIGEHMGLFMHLVEGDGLSATAHKKFYNEYLSVMDLPADFYLETVKIVFQEHSLPEGTLECLGQKIRPQDIKNTALLCIEGERDDISGVGQTKAALELCTQLPDSKKHYHLQKGVGHYGTFNGRRYKEHIVPLLVEFAKKHGN